MACFQSPAASDSGSEDQEDVVPVWSLALGAGVWQEPRVWGSGGYCRHPDLWESRPEHLREEDGYWNPILRSE